MIGAGYTALFGILQALDPTYDAVPQPNGTVIEYPVWPISGDEAKQLGEATAGQLATLPAARRKSIAKFLNEYAPGIILGATLYEVAGPRLRFSIAQKRARRDITLANAANAGGPGGRPAPGYPNHGPTGPAAGPAQNVSTGTGSSGDPFRAAAAANAHGNGVADAFSTDGGVG